MNHARVSPLLIGVSIADLRGLPFALFQCTVFEENDVVKLLRSINDLASHPLQRDQLARNFHNAWGSLAQEINSIDVIGSARLDTTPDSRDMDGALVLARPERDILAYIASGYVHPSDFEHYAYGQDIHDEMGQTVLRTRHQLVRLVGLGLVDEFVDEHDYHYGLTEEGVAYVVNNNLD